MNKTKAKKIHATLLLIISAIFLYTFNASAMVPEFTAGYGNGLDNILPEASNNEPEDYPANPIELLESRLKMSLPEFGQEIGNLQSEIYSISRDPISFYSSDYSFNGIYLTKHLNEIDTMVIGWIDTFNALNFHPPDELIVLHETIQDTQDKIEQLESEIGMSIKEIAGILDECKNELEVLYFIPRDSDYYTTEVKKYLTDKKNEINLYKNILVKYGFLSQSLNDLEQKINGIQNKNNLHISVHVQYPGIWILPFEDLMKTKESTALKEMFIETYLYNVDEEIPQYLQGLSAVLEKYGTDSKTFQNPITAKAYVYLKDFYENLNGLYETGVLTKAAETMKLFKEDFMEKQKESLTTLEFLAQLHILAKDIDIYIQSQLETKNKQLDELTPFIRNMPPDDRTSIEKTVQNLQIEVGFIKNSKTLIEQMLTSITSSVSKTLLDGDPDYIQTRQSLSKRIANLELLKPHMLTDDAQYISSEIMRLKQATRLLESFPASISPKASQLKTDNIASPLTYLNTAKNVPDLSRSTNDVLITLQSQAKTQRQILNTGNPSASYTTLPRQSVAGDKTVQDLNNDRPVELLSEAPMIQTPSTNPVDTKPLSLNQKEELAEAFAVLLNDTTLHSKISDLHSGLFSGLSNPDMVENTILSAFSSPPINQGNHFTDEQTVILGMLGVISLGEDYSNNPVLSSAVNKVTRVILNNYNNTIRDTLPEQFMTIVQKTYLHQNDSNYTLQQLSKETDISENFIIQVAGLLKNHPEIVSNFQLDINSISAPIGYVAIDGQDGFINFTINNPQKSFSLEKFKNLSEKEIIKLSDATNLSKETLTQIQDNILHRKNGVFIIITLDIDGETVPVLVLSDTIVYINSTKPTEVAKEILKRILINRPNASETLVNRAFLLIVIVGLICIGFGIGLAVYITRLQLKKSNYFNPVLSHKKAYQHNFAPSWKTR